jgi:amino acid adenylation domain-containing protein
MKQKILQDKLNESLNQFKTNTAIEYGPRVLTYAQLEKQTNYIANWIREQKIGNETFIGILTDDRMEFITTLVGILKAGCVFIPLDPTLPQKRLELMIHSTNIPFIIGDRENLARLHSTGIMNNPGARLIPGEDLFVGGQESWYLQAPEISYSPEDKIYVYFTSGTTGTPKAIVGRNKGLWHFIDWEIETFGIDETFRVSQFTNPGFDAILRDIFAPLCAGGVICVPDRKDILFNPEELMNWLEKSRVQLIHCVPGLFRLLNANILTGNNFKHLKFILFSGEKINPPDLVEWYNTFDERIQLVNLWGTSETTLAKTYYFIRKTDVNRERIPVGKPMNGARVIVLDENMNICDEQAPGELYIRTPFRTFGYYNDPALNKAKFIQNPFSDRPDDLIHKTGDLGRLLPDGNIEYLGRIDRQVKIRGIRIELEEIESVLAKFPQVKEAVAIKSESSTSNELLYAFVTRKPVQVVDEELFLSNLKEFLSENLPAFMIPAHVEIMEKIPRDSHGKVDFEVLPGIVEYKKNYAPPQTPIEKKLVRLWSEILGIERISIKVHFFDLGGNSLNIMALINKIHKEFDVRIPLGEIFDNPTIETQAQIIMRSKKEIHLTLRRAEEKEYYEQSSAQKRIFILNNINRESKSYNIPTFRLLGGEIDKKKLEIAFSRLIERHEILRTSFFVYNGKLVQKIHHAARFKLDYFEADEEKVTKLSNDFIKPFDLSRQPLLRLGLINLGERHLLMLDMHHIITDGSSLPMFINDLLALYKGENLPGLKIQYRDYTEWQNSAGLGQAIRDQENYWKKEFESPIPILNLPLDYARPVIQNFEGSVLEFKVEKEETDQLKILVSRERVTMNIALMTIFYIILAKVSGQEDIIVGIPLAGRIHEEFRDIIGVMVNIMPLRNYPGAEKTFLQFLNEVKEKVINAQENQEYQFEDLVNHIALNRDTSRNPIFDVLFQWTELSAVPPMQVPGLKIMPYHFDEKISKFDITLRAKEIKDELIFSFEYCSKLFKRETIERFANYFKEILRVSVANPQQELSIIKQTHWQRKGITRTALEAVNDPEIVGTKEQIIQHRLNKSFRKFKDSIAIEYGDRVMSYGELDRRSNHIAHWIIKKGIANGTFIGILIDDKIQFICTMMGILKAGGAFVPLDSTYPGDRVEVMINTAGIQFVFCNTANINRFAAANAAIQFILIDDLFPGEVTAACLPEPVVRYTPQDRIYIYFTSGTTGTPKAIVGKNKSLLHFINWEIDTFEIDESFRISQLTTPVFDAFLRDVFVPLCVGGTICIPYEGEIILNAERLKNWLEGSRVRLIHCVPSLLRLLNSLALEKNHFQHLKFILLSGEKIEPSLLAKWYESIGERIQLVNLWGTSETTLAKTCHFIKRDDINRERIPVGIPIRGAEVMVLDKFMNICDCLVPGELYIRTPFRTYGYYNEPGLNNERFIRNPFGTNPEDLIHRTGDLGRILVDGNIDVLGRNDRQVKIRGIRIELEEIESILTRHPWIKEGVVIKTGPVNNEFLCAYITTTNLADEEAVGSVLKDYLSVKLPEYMAPARVIKLKEIPRNPNGKINFGALPDPLASQRKSYIPPANFIQEKLREFWTDMLGIEEIGITDNFFELGGNSLNVMSLIAVIHKEFDVRIPLGDIFNHPTIEQQAGIIKGSNEDKYASIQPAEEKEYYPLSPAQERHYITQQKDLLSTLYNMPQAVAFEGEIKKDLLEVAFKKLIKRQSSFRTSFAVIDGHLVQKIARDVAFTIEYHELEADDRGKIGGTDKNIIEERSVEKLISRCISPFDLAKAPLLKVSLIKVGDERHILVVDMHHIISDGTSLVLMTNELMALYAGQPLQQLRIQYRDYCQWLNRETEKKNLGRQEGFWLKEFEEEIPVLYLPTDFPRPALMRYEGSSLSVSLGREETMRLKALALKEQVTTFMLLLAVYNIMLARVSGQEDIIVGIPAANRGHADIQPLIGSFANTLVIWSLPKGEKTFREFLKEVKEHITEVFENQDYPFANLVERLDFKRLPGRNPLFDVQFQLERIDFVDMEATGLNFRRYGSPGGTTKLDLMCVGIEAGDNFFFSWHYNTNLFNQATIKKLIGYFENIISSVLENPLKKLSEIEVIPGDKKEKIVSRYAIELEDESD